MAAKLFSRSVLPKHTSISSLFSTSSSSFTPLTASRLFSSSSLSTSTLFRLRTLSTVAVSALRHLPPSTGVRGFATRQTNSSLNDPNPNWSNRPPKETILLDGCDFEHWLVVMEKPEGDPTRDEIIESYIKTLAMVIGSEQEARMKIYSVSTQCYFAFGALVPEELSYKIKELPRVRWVLPDSYLNVREKDYGGEPFINGEAVPYDPKYHEEWKRNNQRANERNRRNDRPRNQDRSRNFNRRENMQNRDFNNGPPMPPNQNMHNPPPNVGGPVSHPSNSMAPPLNNTDALGGPSNMRSPPPSNFRGPSGQGGYQNNNGGGQGGYQNNIGGGQGGYQNNIGGGQGGYSGQGGYAQSNTGGGQGGYAQNNTGGGQGGYAQNNTGGGQGGFAQNNMGGQGGYSSNNNMGGQGRYSPDTGGSPGGVQQNNLMPPNNMGRIPDRNGGSFQNSRDVPNNGGGLPYQNSRDGDVPEFNQNAGIPGGNAFQA